MGVGIEGIVALTSPLMVAPEAWALAIADNPSSNEAALYLDTLRDAVQSMAGPGTPDLSTLGRTPSRADVLKIMEDLPSNVLEEALRRQVKRFSRTEDTVEKARAVLRRVSLDTFVQLIREVAGRGRVPLEDPLPDLKNAKESSLAGNPGEARFYLLMAALKEGWKEEANAILEVARSLPFEVRPQEWARWYELGRGLLTVALRCLRRVSREQREALNVTKSEEQIRTLWEFGDEYQTLQENPDADSIRRLSMIFLRRVKPRLPAEAEILSLFFVPLFSSSGVVSTELPAEFETVEDLIQGLLSPQRSSAALTTLGKARESFRMGDLNTARSHLRTVKRYAESEGADNLIGALNELVDAMYAFRRRHSTPHSK